MKTCTSCGASKHDDQFPATGGGRWLRGTCKGCATDAVRHWRSAKAMAGNCPSCGKERVDSRCKCLGAKQEWRRKRAESAGRAYRTKEQLLQDASRRESDRLLEKQQRTLHDAHVREWKANKTVYLRWRYQHEPAYGLKERIRRQLRKKGVALPGLAELIGSALKRGGESSTVERVLGYSITQLREHLERQFTKGMTWDGLGRKGWHVDHILPKKFFDLSSIEGVRAYWSLSNLRPLFAAENLVKGSKRLHLV